MDFVKRYNKLNSGQKKAVDTTEGPVMVIAGPGTGKTELLGVRVANILQKTDTLPENILCLTFTDSGANAMRQRLTDIIGKDAYKVAVHTFHSFGSEIINQNRQYFYNGANFKPADKLNSYEIIRDIFENLKHDSPIISKMNDEYTHSSEVQKVISDIKKSGLSSSELIEILDKNDIVINQIEKLINPIFSDRISGKIVSKLEGLITEISLAYIDEMPLGIISLATLLKDSLISAIDEATVGEKIKTPAITKWRNDWFKKDKQNNFIFKSRERQAKLRGVAEVYEQYIAKMQAAELYDFDDMILQVVHKMEENDDLRFNLQEQYQYIMVDEFQDTNMAQMRILHNLTNNEVQADTPNILVVGDDDQAIYSFQGAEVSNIINFKNTYPRTELITLSENYRSTSDILDNSRQIILQGDERLENSLEGINKELNANHESDKNEILLYEAGSITDERHFIASNIKTRIESGQKPSTIAVLTRKHKDIISLLPYLYNQNISVSYEHHDNALEQEPIKLIEKIANLLILLSNGRHDEADAKLPEILAHPAWGISALDIWSLSTTAHDKHARWLDTMAQMPIFVPIQSWMINNAAIAQSASLERMLDIIVGKPTEEDTIQAANFTSPLYEYFFSISQIKNTPNQYLIYLESLRAIRSKLREYHIDQTPNLETFVHFIKLSHKIKTVIAIKRQATVSDNLINLMTAHSAKGLEFETVYVINSTDNTWGNRSRGNVKLISYPENLKIAPAGETEDERLRLFYVAITRAKDQLYISYSLKNDNDKDTMKAIFLADSNLKIIPIAPPDSLDKLVGLAEIDWYQPLITPTTETMKELLAPTLAKYKLSVTHLNSFLDIVNSGPQLFLIKNLLKFPQEKSANAAFGTAIHDTLQSSHSYLSANSKRKPIEDLLIEFENNLKSQHLDKTDLKLFLQKGKDTLTNFLDKKYDSFSPAQVTELDFSNQHSIIEEAHITGKLDLVDINKADKTIVVTDYKTGKQIFNWFGGDDNQKIKAYKYKQQLLFYKLLVENSRDYHSYQVDRGIMQFVEPTNNGEIIDIEASFSIGEVEHFKKLITAVWKHIIDLNLPETSNYDQSIKGILQFEDDLINNNI
ncbi:MAG: ATP-dependent DNA helicase [Candidatus Saccharibacteria bacterium]